MFPMKKSISTYASFCTFAAFAMSVFLPLTTIIIWSLAGRWSWPHLLPQSFTLRGMQELFFRKEELAALFISSFVISSTVAVLSVIIGIISARILVLYSFKGRRLITFLSFLPLLVPTTVFGMGAHGHFIRWGLSDTLTGVILAHLIYSLPYTILTCTSAFEAVGNKYEEQACVLGANPWTVFIRITVPLISPVLPPAFGMAYIVSFSQYFLTLIIGGGSVKTFSIVMVPYLQNGDRTIAGCYSFVFLCSTAALFIAGDMLYRRKGSAPASFYV